MTKNQHKRIDVYEICLTVFLFVNLFLDLINNYLLNTSIPVEIVGYLFWLSLGLYLGFRLYKYELGRINKRNQISKENE
jgi:hypothetical protein